MKLNDTKPNIILCQCDQLRAFELGCYGNRIINTPNIDQLGYKGFRFNHAVTSNPVCMAARSSLLSGQYSRTCNGNLINDYVNTVGKPWRTIEPEFPEHSEKTHLRDPTLPEILEGAGYECATIGKWHIRPSPELLGFSYSVLPLNNHRHSNQQFLVDGKDIIDLEGFSVEREIERVEEFLNNWNSKEKKNPFFLYYNIMPPHMPLGDMPKKYLNMYDPRDILLRPNVFVDGELPFSDEWFKIYLWDYVYYHYNEPHTNKLPMDFDIRQLVALYYGGICWVDCMIGRMLNVLHECSLEEDTIVIFTSDHGDMLGSHHRWNKGVLFQESIRIPMIFHFPKKWKNDVNHDQVASTIDIMPTILEAIGFEKPAHLQGRSLMPILRGDTANLDENWSYVETSSSSGGQYLTEIGIRTPSHILGMCLDFADKKLVDQNFCFYDLENDPFELDNIVQTGRSSNVESSLKERLLLWNEKTPWLEDPRCDPDRGHLFDENGMPNERRF